jgi:hypothetical protein
MSDEHERYQVEVRIQVTMVPDGSPGFTKQQSRDLTGYITDINQLLIKLVREARDGKLEEKP